MVTSLTPSRCMTHLGVWQNKVEFYLWGVTLAEVKIFPMSQRTTRRLGWRRDFIPGRIKCICSPYLVGSSHWGLIGWDWLCCMDLKIQEQV